MKMGWIFFYFFIAELKTYSTFAVENWQSGRMRQS
jgi:hypothetical protein